MSLCGKDLRAGKAWKGCPYCLRCTRVLRLYTNRMSGFVALCVTACVHLSLLPCRHYELHLRQMISGGGSVGFARLALLPSLPRAFGGGRWQAQPRRTQALPEAPSQQLLQLHLC